MTLTKYGYHKTEYIIEVKKWAKALGADDITINYDGSVTLTCKDGGICHNYKPTPKELQEV